MDDIFFSDDSEKQYFYEINQYPVLSIESQKALALRYKETGDLKAREMLINSNLRYVVFLASKFRNSVKNMSFLDIVFEGNCGLFKAIEHYEPDKSAFITYATSWILAYIKRGILHQDNLIDESDNLNEKRSKYLKLVSCGIVDKDVLCKKLNVSLKRLQEIESSFERRTISLEHSVYDKKTVEDYILDDKQDMEKVINGLADKELLFFIKHLLTPMQYYVIYYNVLSSNRKTLIDIANLFNVTFEDIRQIKLSGLNVLKPYFKSVSLYKRRKQEFVRNIKFNSYKIEPIKPEAIVKFLFLKNDLSLLEKNIYALYIFGDYNYQVMDYVSLLDVSKKDFSDAYRSLQLKLSNFDRKKFVGYFKKTISKFHCYLLNPYIINYFIYEKEFSDYSLADFDLTVLSNRQISLLNRFFGSDNSFSLSSDVMEREVNLSKYCYDGINLSKDKLYAVFLANRDSFSLSYQDELDNYFKNDGLVKRDLLMRLELYYYNLDSYFDYNFTKENYFEVRNRYYDKFSKDKLMVLDNFYNGFSLKDIAEKMGLSYEEVHGIFRNARQMAIGLRMHDRIDLDKSLYLPYVLDGRYHFASKEVLKKYLVDGMSNEMISKELGLARQTVSGMILDGLNYIDKIRFGLEDVMFVRKDELLKFFGLESFSDVDKNIIELSFVDGKETKDIVCSLNVSSSKVTQTKRNFKKLYYRYLVRDVLVTDEDISYELNDVASILSCEEKKMLDDSALVKIKAHKVGLIHSDLFLSKEKMIGYLSDCHLPISSDERILINYLYGLDGYDCKSFEDLESVYKKPKRFIRQSYKNALVKILKYGNKEIKGVISYENDIVPNLKYFSLFDRQLLTLYYKEHLSYSMMANVLNLTYHQIENSLYKLNYELYDLLNNKDAKKFDFDYYLEAIKNPSLPFYGDLDLAVKVFDLATGMSGNFKINTEGIISYLQLDCKDSVVRNSIYSLMLSVCKLRDGLVKKTFSYEDVKGYYQKYKNGMDSDKLEMYNRYLKRVDSSNSIYKYCLNSVMLNDLIKEYGNGFDINCCSKDEVIEVLDNVSLSKEVQAGLKTLFQISDRELFNSKELLSLGMMFVSNGIKNGKDFVLQIKK